MLARTSLWLSSLAFLAAACGGSSSYQERQAALVQARAASALLVGKAEPPSSCRLLGAQQSMDPKVYAPFASFGANSDDALEALREKAVERGANYVVLDFVAGPSAQGRLFACPSDALATLSGPGGGAAPPAAMAPASPASPACKPDCSPGYACVDGSCVSACNPPCAAGKTCGADRICH
jgi:hypothetical protein